MVSFHLTCNTIIMPVDLLNLLVNVNTNVTISYKYLRILDAYYILNKRYRTDESTMHFINYDIMLY